MNKKKSDPTFGSMIAEVKTHVAKLREQHGETRFIPQLIWEGFTASYKIAAEHRYYPDFGSDLACVLTYRQLYKSLKEIEQFWLRWPIQVTVFGMFQHQGSSALEVAARFTESINAAALAMRVTEFETFYSDEFTQPELERWAAVLGRELHDNTLSLSI